MCLLKQDTLNLFQETSYRDRTRIYSTVLQSILTKNNPDVGHFLCANIYMASYCIHVAYFEYLKYRGAVVVLIVWWLDLQLPMQSIPINTKIMCSNSAHGDVYLKQLYVRKFVNDLPQVGDFLRVLRLPPLIKLTDTI